jgi:hypothetical protein
MSRRSFLLPVWFAAVLTLPLAGLSVPVTAATEEGRVSRVVLGDPTGDVWAIGEGEDEHWESAGEVPTADVVGAVVRHGRRNVMIRMTFADLRRVEPQYYFATIFSRRQYGAVFVSAAPPRWKGRHELVDGRFHNVSCPKLSHSIDYDTEQVTVRVPRGCIGRPEWVRVGMANYMFRGETEDDFQELTDNPHSTDPEGRHTRRLYRTTS